MKKSKILVMIIIIILLLAVAGTVFGYLYIATDTFKSDSELFTKYISQTIQGFKELTDLKSIETYKNLKNENKYESNIEIAGIHSEGGEISNPLNELKATVDIQKDKQNNYFYADGQILLAEDEYLEVELIKEQELYGIRFSDVAKQFTTFKDDENLVAVAKDIGVEVDQLIEMMDMIDGNKGQGTSGETVQVDKYTNILKDVVLNGAFSKNKNIIIKYNNNDVEANAYTVVLSSEQVGNMLIQILNNVKSENITLFKENIETSIDDIINKISENTMPEIKITVYEQNGQTIKTIIEVNSYIISIENIVQNGTLKFIVQISNENNEYNITLNKNATETQEKVDMIVEIVSGEEENKLITISNNMELGNNTISSNTSFKYQQGILEVGANLTASTKLNSEFEKKLTLDNTNNVVLNDLDQERRLLIINALKESVPKKVETRTNLLLEALQVNNTGSEETQEPTENEMTQIDINKFNAKYEFYTGESVSADNVKILLDIAKNDLGSCEITTNENTDTETSGNVKPEDLKYTFKLNIEKDKENVQEIEKVLENIKEKGEYTVTISYNESNGLISHILIKENEK